VHMSFRYKSFRTFLRWLLQLYVLVVINMIRYMYVIWDIAVLLAVGQMTVTSIGLLYCYLISWHVSAVQNTLDVAWPTYYTYVQCINNSIHILIIWHGIVCVVCLV
jgi:hypothetical protein